MQLPIADRDADVNPARGVTGLRQVPTQQGALVRIESGVPESVRAPMIPGRSTSATFGFTTTWVSKSPPGSNSRYPSVGRAKQCRSLSSPPVLQIRGRGVRS